MDANAILTAFRQKFGTTPQILVQAPGRINLIGEHTDYNDGFVLPAAINYYTWLAVSLNDSRLARFWAANPAEAFRAELSALRPAPVGWANYLMGILDQLLQEGHPVSGLDCAFGGNLPVGAGMSASAALECGFAFALDQLLSLGKTRRHLARLAQRASHTFSGIPCGIMDQTAVLLGKAGHFLQLDCRSLDYEYIPADLGDHVLVLLDSGVRHHHADSGYATRVQECRAGVSAMQELQPEVRSLRDVTPDTLQILSDALEPTVFRRCRHVVTANDRLHRAVLALRQGDIPALGDLLFAAHASLRDDYEVSCPELDILVDFAANHRAVAGARLMGGGFGGCTINLIRQEAEATFVLEALAEYRRQTGKKARHFSMRIGEGIVNL